MKNILLLLSFMIIGCKDTGVHIIDNPDGTSVKVSYWGGNNEDNQPNIIQVGNRGKYMTVSHNVNIMTKYDARLIFELENGQKVVFECNETAQKRDYSGELETDWEGKPKMECLEHKVAESTVRFIKVGAMAKFGI